MKIYKINLNGRTLWFTDETYFQILFQRKPFTRPSRDYRESHAFIQPMITGQSILSRIPNPGHGILAIYNATLFSSKFALLKTLTTVVLKTFSPNVFRFSYDVRPWSFWLASNTKSSFKLWFLNDSWDSIWNFAYSESNFEIFQRAAQKWQRLRFSGWMRNFILDLTQDRLHI